MFDVITIGTATQDVFLRSKSFRVVKDPYFTKAAGFPSGEAECFALGGKLEVEEMHLTTGGGATNAAVTFALQGFRVATVAKVGNDAAGAVIERELKKLHISPFLRRDNKERTAYSTLLLTSGGERTVLVYRGASEKLSSADIPWSKMKAKWAYFASGGIDFPLLAKLVNFFNRQGALIAVNPGKAQLSLGLKHLMPIIKKTKVLILNREEAARLSGVPYEAEKKIFKVLDRAVGGILVVTDGKSGVHVSDSLSRLHAGIFKERKIVDRTGAGDSFGSGFVAGLMQKGERCERGACKPTNLEFAIRLATANATSNVESIGAKSGLLTRSAFKNERWKNFPIQKLV